MQRTRFVDQQVAIGTAHPDPLMTSQAKLACGGLVAR
jgi:hypothetical protein